MPLASVRDYDQALATRPVTQPARIFGEDVQRRIVPQVLEWLDERRHRIHLYITIRPPTAGAARIISGCIGR